MAKKFGFFNSINGDRKYLASDISQAFDIGVTTGIKAEENNLKVVVYEGMQVQIQPGSAMIFGHFFMNDEPEIIDIDTADAELNRIDRVVVRYDAYTREVNTAVIKGSLALSPTPPARLETGEQFDLVLADIYVPAAATVINTSNITDMRDSELCGYIGVKGAVTKFEFESHLADNTKHLVDGSQNLSVFANEQKKYKEIRCDGRILSTNLIAGGKFTTSAKKLITLGRGNMILVSGMYDYDLGRTFSDVLVATSFGEVNVLQSAERGFVHSRTYMVDGESLMLAMGNGQYIVVAENIQHEMYFLGG